MCEVGAARRRATDVAVSAADQAARAPGRPCGSRRTAREHSRSDARPVRRSAGVEPVARRHRRARLAGSEARLASAGRGDLGSAQQNSIRLRLQDGRRRGGSGRRWFGRGSNQENGLGLSALETGRKSAVVVTGLAVLRDGNRRLALAGGGIGDHPLRDVTHLPVLRAPHVHLNGLVGGAQQLTGHA